MKQRDYSIDILKFFAVLAITNSHMEVLYGKYSALATGGAIGDVLFFFASGFTLFLGGLKSFDNYYKRRINRIYPTVFSWAVVSCLLFGRDYDIIYILLYGGGWFVSCIMIYYVVLYFIRRYLINHLKLVFFISLGVSVGLYFVFYDDKGFNMYGGTFYKWVFYFLFMLQGAMLGLYSQRSKIIINKWWLDVVKVMACVVTFYLLCGFKNSESLNFIQMLSIIPLIGIVHYTYRICNIDGFKRFFITSKVGWCMNAIGGLCLEIYLVQGCLFSDKLNFIFPANIPIIFICIVVFAYVIRCLSRIWSQTFKDNDYNWKEVFRVVSKY